MAKAKGSAGSGILYTSTSDRIFDAVNYILLIIIALVVLYPLVFVLSASISDPVEVVTGRVFLWPRGFSLDAYLRVFTNQTILMGYRNSIYYTIVGVTLSMLMTIGLAFGLSRTDLKGSKLFMVLITLTMFFDGGLAPLYITVKNLGLIGNYWSIILPSLMSAYNMIIMKAYFQSSIPYSIQEAAVIDGCSPFKLLTRIIVPLSKPVIAVVTLFYALTRWNSYFSCLLFLSSQKELWTIQLVVREVVIQSTTTEMMETGQVGFEQIMAKESLKYATIIVVSLPMLILYPFIQKFFVKGIMIGSVKG